jgi:monofunctional biosynthetic peptidoglycan transglycosylase
MTKARRTKGGGLSFRAWIARAVVAWVVLTAGTVLVLRWVDPPTSAFMVARRVAAWRKDERHFQLRYQWVDRSRISPNLVRALVAAEDQSFVTHHGFDWGAMRDAWEDRMDGKSKRGGSTLTQQVAKNLFLWSGRTVFRKVVEAYFTVLMEVLWPKARIIEMHLNLAEYGNGLYGVEQASRVYFGKSAAAVTADEAARLVVVLPGPKSRRVNSPSASMQERTEWVRDQMARLNPSQIDRL